MTLVDSSVWIDYFRGVASAQTDKLDSLFDSELLAIGDLVLAELLQGFTDDAQFEQARRLLTSLEVVELGGLEIALKAARNFRTLRRAGSTVRKTIDSLIATWCIEKGYSLLHNDRDFEPFSKHLRLHSVL